jgi:arginyl-tRNA synthetase
MMVEFVSPTPPARCTWAMAARRRWATPVQPVRHPGLAVHREFYYNDAGVQIDTLTTRCSARQGPQARRRRLARGGLQRRLHPTSPTTFWPEDRQADDREFTANGDVEDYDNIRQFAVAYLRHEQDKDLQAFNLKFDEYYLESSLYTSGRVEPRCKS